MTWDEIRSKYPGRWVVVEAINAHTEDGKRLISQLEISEVFGNDWKQAWEHYKTVHHADKWREYYMLHTDRLELNIGVIDTFGRVIADKRFTTIRQA